MTGELLRLFRDGGGKQAVPRDAFVRPGPRPSAAHPPPGYSVAVKLAEVEEEAMDWAVAMDLAMGQGHASREAVQRAREFLKSWNGGNEEAALMLLDSRVQLETRFGVTAWDAYWAVLHRAYRRGASPLDLVQALVRALDEDSADHVGRTSSQN